MDVNTLLALDRSGRGIMVKKPAIPRCKSGLHLFASRTFRKGKVVGNYCSFLVYANLTGEWHKTKMYAESVMQVTAEAFRNWANELLENCMDRNEIKKRSE